MALLLAAAVTTLGAPAARADRVTLRTGTSGTIKECVILGETETGYRVRLRIGTTTFPKSRVVEVERQSEDENAALIAKWEGRPVAGVAPSESAPIAWQTPLRQTIGATYINKSVGLVLRELSEITGVSLAANKRVRGRRVTLSRSGVTLGQALNTIAGQAHAPLVYEPDFIYLGPRADLPRVYVVPGTPGAREGRAKPLDADFAHVSPALADTLRTPVSLDFEDTKLSAALKFLSNVTKVQFLGREDQMRSRRVTVFVNDVPLLQGVRLLLADGNMGVHIIVMQHQRGGDLLVLGDPRKTYP